MILQPEPDAPAASLARRADSVSPIQKGPTMNATKKATPNHPIQEVIANRWSPYAFADRPVSKADLCLLFEAARWAPSSYNEQPWRYIVATKAEPAEFARLLSCLVDGNQAWAKAAPVLALGCTQLVFNLNGKPNAAAIHDLGLAAGNLCLEATARGLCVHQMIGILPDKARETYKIPDNVQPLTALAIGYEGDPNTLPDAMKPRDLSPRTRKPFAEWIFSGTWGSASSLVK
jgi:nitroreductase